VGLNHSGSLDDFLPYSIRIPRAVLERSLQKETLMVAKISRFLTIGDLKTLLANLPDNALIGTVVNGEGGKAYNIERWRIVQHRATKRVGIILGDESLPCVVDTDEGFHENFTLLLGDHSFDVRNLDPDFRNKKNEDIIDDIFGD
jgi:hypothetical protein